MCYCTPEIRTPVCQKCASWLVKENERLEAERDDWKQKAIHWDGMYKYQRDCYDTLRSEKEKLQAERDELVAASTPYLDQYFRDEQPKSFGCNHTAKTCWLCKDSVARWEQQRNLRAALAKIEGRG